MTNPLHLAAGGWLSSCVAVAAQLGIADLVANDAQTADELARSTKTFAPMLDRMLRTLAAAGIFTRDDEGRYTNTPDSELLRSDHPRSVRRFCMLAGGEYYRAFSELAHTVATGEPAFRHLFGGSIYEYMEGNRAAADAYDGAMEELARPVAEAVAHTFDFTNVQRVIDVGGGSGAMIRAIARAHPHVHTVSFDRADVCARAVREERVDFVAGDFFAKVPTGADVYLLKNVLHNWNDHSAEAILRTVRAALNGGKLLVIEPLLSERETSLPKLLDDLMMAVICEQGTAARTEAQMRALLDRASLRAVEVTPLPTGHTVVTALAAERSTAPA